MLPPLRRVARAYRWAPALLFASLLVACDRSPEAVAIRELGRRGIEANPAAYVASARAGDAEALRLLRAAGVSGDPVDPASGETALVAAIEAGYEGIAAAELAAGADPNAAAEGGRPALAGAVAGQMPALAEALLAAGADPDADLAPGMPLAFAAAEAGDFALLDRLRDAGADVDRRGGPVAQTAFAAALDRRDEAAALRLFALGAHPAFALSAEGAPVERAAGFRMNALLARMLERGWSPAGIAGCGAPLLAAVRSHNLEGARLLLDAGAAPPPGALRLACLRRDLPMARLLLEHGADPAGIVLLAWEFRDRRLLGLLAEFCADVDEACPDTGQRALAAAAEAGDLGFAKALLAAGADPDLPGADTQPPLAYALARRDAAFVDLLLKGGADPNTRLNTPVSESFRARFDMEDKELGYYLAKIDSGFTALMIAAAQNDLASARLLLKRGARTNLLTKKWRRYPINFAVDRGHLQMAQLIVGRDPESDSRKVHIVIDLSDQRARFIQDGEVVLSTRVSTGKKGNETKPGEYLVTFKHKDHRSNLYDAPMPFFLRLSCSDFGLHEGNVPGYPASHGCIRVPKKTAEKLFGMARLGDLVTIQE